MKKVRCLLGHHDWSEVSKNIPEYFLKMHLENILISPKVNQLQQNEILKRYPEENLEKYKADIMRKYKLDSLDFESYILSGEPIECRQKCKNCGVTRKWTQYSGAAELTADD